MDARIPAVAVIAGALVPVLAAVLALPIVLLHVPVLAAVLVLRIVVLVPVFVLVLALVLVILDAAVGVRDAVAVQAVPQVVVPAALPGVLVNAPILVLPALLALVPVMMHVIRPAQEIVRAVLVLAAGIVPAAREHVRVVPVLAAGIVLDAQELVPVPVQIIAMINVQPPVSNPAQAATDALLVDLLVVPAVHNPVMELVQIPVPMAAPHPAGLALVLVLHLVRWDADLPAKGPVMDRRRCLFRISK
ncbi:MAG: hypothetical protein Q4C52_11945 [Eubacteriales bacterium]|nr:hypothetical protein [Eubacteriales bacterium]